MSECATVRVGAYPVGDRRNVTLSIDAQALRRNLQVLLGSATRFVLRQARIDHEPLDPRTMVDALLAAPTLDAAIDVLARRLRAGAPSMIDPYGNAARALEALSRVDLRRAFDGVGRLPPLDRIVFMLPSDSNRALRVGGPRSEIALDAAPLAVAARSLPVALADIDSVCRAAPRRSTFICIGGEHAPNPALRLPCPRGVSLTAPGECSSGGEVPPNMLWCNAPDR
jgi:hypothetical protein